MAQSIQEAFTRRYRVLAVAPHRLLDVFTAGATEDKRDAETGPGEALFEVQTAAVADLAAMP